MPKLPTFFNTYLKNDTNKNASNSTGTPAVNVKFGTNQSY